MMNSHRFTGVPAMHLAQFSQWLPFLLFAFVASITPRSHQPTGVQQQRALRLECGVTDHAWRLRRRSGAGAGGGQRAGRSTGQPATGATGDERSRRALAELAGLADLPQPAGRPEARYRRRAPGSGRRCRAAAGQSQDLDDGAGGDQRIRRLRRRSIGRVQLLSLLFFLVSIPCMAVWAGLGIGSQRLLSPRQMQRLNQLMAILLLVSAWAGVLL